MHEATSSSGRSVERPPGAPRVTFSDALCAVDGTPESLAAIAHAGSIVGPDGHLTLLIATAFRHESEMRGPAIPPARATEIVEQAQRAARDAGVSATVEVDPGGAPAELILRWSAGRDLLALGAPATSSWFGSIFMHGVASAAEEMLDTPLLISREGKARGGSAAPASAAPQQILIASDGLEDSDGLVELAGRLAATHGAATTLLHVLGAEERLHPHRIERQAQQLAAVPRSSSELRVELGTPRNVIVEVARAVEADLILMSSRRLSGLHAFGSVSRPVAQHAHCAVLLMPPELVGAPPPP